MTLHLPTIIIRYALVLLFGWFSIEQLINPEAWIGFLPEWSKYLTVPPEMLVRLNGWFELVFALMLALGFYTRFISAILGLHLLTIGWTAGGAIGMRDVILGLCAFSLVAGKPDDWTYDFRSGYSSKALKHETL